MKKLTGFALLPVMVCMTPAFAEDDIGYNAEFSLTNDDNLNRNIISAEEVKDTFATTSIGVHQAHRLSDIDYINLNAQLKYERFNDISGLDNVEAGVGLRFNVKPVAGFTEPVYIFSADASVIDSATDIRDTTVFNLGMAASKWVTSTLSTRGGVAYRIKDSDSRVFDLKDLRFFINGDLLLSDHLTMYATVNYINGQTVSTVDMNNFSPEVLKVIDLADQFEFDPAFGANQIAYRFDSTTRSLTVGFNYALAQKHSLDLSVRNIHSKAGGQIDYAVTQFSLAYLLSF